MSEQEKMNENPEVETNAASEDNKTDVCDKTDDAGSTENGHVKSDVEAKDDNADANSGAPTDLEAKIIRQIEYYFGDINLPKDKFLQEQIKEDDGWITLETMTKFNRLNQLSSDISVLATAIGKATSGLIELHESKLKIRRSAEKPIPEFNQQRRDDIRSRSIYAKGFPEDSTLDSLLEFFEKVGKTEHIFMRRTVERVFKGSCFVLYATIESAKTFVDSDEMAKFGDIELTRSFKDVYFKQKAEKLKAQKLEKKKSNEEKEKQPKEKEDADVKLEDRITKGAVLHMDKIPPETTREDLKSVFEGTHTVAWVEFDRGDTEGKLRFQGENSAVEAFEQIKQENEEGKVKVRGQEVECRIVEGDEELDYWKSVFQAQKDKREQGRQNRNNRFGGRGRGRGGYYGNRDRGYKRKSGSDGSEATSAKISKASD